MIKKILKKILPKPAISLYHYLMTWLAALIYRFPSRKMVIIGVTGTSGKTTTAYLIVQLLELLGYKSGLTSTAVFKIAEKEWLNDKKMSMLGRFQTQKLLRQMVKTGCTHAVVETTSEGVLQHRQKAIHYDTLVFTNLSPEHIESHGSFDNYKKAKLKIFSQLEKSRTKKLKGKKIPKTIIVNLDDEVAKDFLNFKVDQKITFSTAEELKTSSPQPIIATNINSTINGLDFEIENKKFHSPMLGEFNVYNNLAAIAALKAQGISLDKIKEVLPQTKPCPGRIEMIDAGQNFTVIVDYAFEPKALNGLYQLVNKIKLPESKIIHLTGSTGGGRDKARRPLNGNIAAMNADYVIVADEDPYDEDPMEIINQVAAGARQKGKIENKNLFKFLDRREGIRKALSLAQKNDIVLITGKGCEQAMALANGKLLPWDDRKVVKEEIKSLNPIS